MIELLKQLTVLKRLFFFDFWKKKFSRVSAFTFCLLFWLWECLLIWEILSSNVSWFSSNVSRFSSNVLWFSSNVLWLSSNVLWFRVMFHDFRVMFYDFRVMFYDLIFLKRFLPSEILHSCPNGCHIYHSPYFLKQFYDVLTPY